MRPPWQRQAIATRMAVAECGSLTVSTTATMKKGRLVCADVRDHGGHSHPCGRDPDCIATAGECCDHCYWTMS